MTFDGPFTKQNVDFVTLCLFYSGGLKNAAVAGGTWQQQSESGKLGNSTTSMFEERQQVVL